MSRFLKWNTGGRRKTGIIWFAALLSAGLWGLSLWQGERLEAYAGDIQIRYHGQGIPRQIAERMREAGFGTEETDFPEIAAWNVEYYVEAKNPVLDFKQKVTCITASGPMDQIVKDRLLAGNYGYADDAEGCIISSKTAWGLFGATKVTGRSIIIKGKRFLVRGVTAASYPLVILPAEAAGTEYFTGISFTGSALGGLEGLAEDMTMRFGLPGDGIRINGSFYYAVVRFCCTLPGWAALFVTWRFIRYRKKCDSGSTWSGKGHKRRICRVLIFFVLAGAAVSFLWFGFRFPEDFVPSRWSDFSFYPEKFRQIKENILDIATLPKTRWDTEMTGAFAASVLCSLQAAIIINVTGSLTLRLPAAEGRSFLHKPAAAETAVSEKEADQI